jgi:Acyclic terpene utilisation family protein AtuA
LTRSIRIGNAQAFWGDRGDAAAELLALEPGLDYLTMDYLAEVSMSILAIQRERDPELGYARDFVEVVRTLSSYWSAGGRCRLVVNAGGLNPMGCARACAAVLEKTGCRPLKIGVVGGDDVLPILSANSDATRFRNLDSGADLKSVADRLVTANAYIGAAGIVDALRQGADIVITGRVADPSLVVGPCIFEFGWSADDWKRLAGATVAGHLIECGTHVTGGISTDWLSVPDPVHIGFPVIEIDEQGDCVVTKPDRSGGRVTEATVKEQLVYEIGDPSKYMSPDVQVSFQDLVVKQISENRVRVTGAVGRPCPSTLKVSATYRDGYRAAGMLTIFGPQANAKARRCGEIVLQRLSEMGYSYRDSLVECLGSGDSVPVLPEECRASDAYECVLRIAVESETRENVERFAREMIPLVTAGPQGTTGYAEGRPNVHSIFRYWPCLIESKFATYRLEMLTTIQSQTSPAQVSIPRRLALASTSSEGTKDAMFVQAQSARRDLNQFALGRSGDKGTGANIGVIARRPEHFEWLRQWLTAERVHQYFACIGVESVERFELPNMHALNFVVRGILRRGLRNDAQGKALAQALLAMPVDDDRPQI